MGTLPQTPEGVKSAVGQFGLALLVSANAVAVLSHGMFGLGATFTGACYLASIALLFCLGRWNAIDSDSLPTTWRWACFSYTPISSAVHPPADFRQAVLLSVALAAYPAARGLASPAHGSIFKLVLAAILGAGCPATAVALAASPDRLQATGLRPVWRRAGKLCDIAGHFDFRFGLLTNQDPSDRDCDRCSCGRLCRLTSQICACFDGCIDRHWRHCGTPVERTTYPDRGRSDCFCPRWNGRSAAHQHSFPGLRCL